MRSARYGVEPIRCGLASASSSYYTFRARLVDRTQHPARAQRDDILCEQIQRVWERNGCMYGLRIVWQQLLRDGQTVAHCTIARHMAADGLRGVLSGQRPRTTIAYATAELSLDFGGGNSTASVPLSCWSRPSSTSRRGAVSCTSHSSSIVSGVASSDGARIPRYGPIWWYTRTAGRNTSPCRTPEAWRQRRRRLR